VTAGEPTDRRAVRTRRSLRTALVALILERGWEKVTVSDVCERADVGRSTFYTHYVDKEDLLLSGFEDLRKSLRAMPRDASRPLGFARGLIEHAREHEKLFRAAVGKRSGQLHHKRFRELVIRLVDEDLEPHVPAGPRRSATARYVAGAFIELLTWWLESRNPLTAAELEELVTQLTFGALGITRRNAPRAR
jgi:AcrR family transcriptional regulator